MTLRKHNGKTVFGIYTKYPLEDNVVECLDELCKMVDKRDDTIRNANDELLKRGCRISELEQELADTDSAKTARGHVIESLEMSVQEWTGQAYKECERAGELEEELKCIKYAKDKTDAENTRLWALDKNEMHRKYEELHAHHLYEVGSLNDTIDDQCNRIQELKEMLSGKSYTVKLHDTHIDCMLV